MSPTFGVALTLAITLLCGPIANAKPKSARVFLAKELPLTVVLTTPSEVMVNSSEPVRLYNRQAIQVSMADGRMPVLVDSGCFRPERVAGTAGWRLMAPTLGSCEVSMPLLVGRGSKYMPKPNGGGGKRRPAGWFSSAFSVPPRPCSTSVSNQRVPCVPCAPPLNMQVVFSRPVIALGSDFGDGAAAKQVHS